MDTCVKYKVPNIVKGTGIVLVLLLSVSIGFAPPPGGPSMTPYCCYPPFVTTVVPPNILLAIDNSGSMADRAYSSTTMYMTDTTIWYGNFNPDSNYKWQVNRFVSDPTGDWPGNVLNWACMSRIDVVKKALIGGEGNKQGSSYRLVSEGRNSWNKTYARDKVNYNTFRITHSAAGKTEVEITKMGLTPPIDATLSKVEAKVDIPEEEYGGVLDQIGDKDGDEHWDDDAPLFGTWFFNNDRAGHIGDYIGDPDIIDLRNRIDNLVCNTWTPLAESYFEILHYFSQADAYYDGGNYSENPGGVHDPYYDKPLREMAWCRRSFVLLLTDGASTMDQEIPDSDISMPGCIGLQNYYDGIDPTLPDNGTDYLDDVTLYGHINDLRPDKGTWGARILEGMQEITVYIIYAFGSDQQAVDLLISAAKTGGFEDKNGNNLPDLQEEWDEDGDSIPDNYFQVTNGYELESSIMSAIAEMLESITSGSAVGVVAMGSSAGGGTAQAQFWPRKTFGKTDELTWIGTVNSYWLDPFGHIREDTNEDAIMHLQNDYILSMQYDVAQNNVMVDIIHDVNGTGEPDQFDTLRRVPIEQVKSIWDAGNMLYDMNPADRLIGTFVDIDQDGFVDAGEMRYFDFPQDVFLREYLGCETVEEADTIIGWIRGYDIPGKRSRTTGGKVWKLSDIINSGASAIQRPLERYDFIYGDIEYADYYDLYKNRRQVVFVGANDGMLHCFNAGTPELLTSDPMEPFKYNPDGYALGAELWAWIPYNLLPHLRWLPNPDYCHVYYVDLKPYVTDAKIFTVDATHPHGWGTLLIAGMRMGGLPISNDADDFSSAYFAIDVTNPVSPVPLWEFRYHDELEMTLCYPTVIKVQDSWFLVLGSGPATCSGESSQNAKIMVLDLTTGQLLKEWTFPHPESFITNIFGCDWGMDYTVDRIYFGDCWWDNPRGWKGSMFRIDTNDETDPGLWDTTTVFDAERPITGEGSVAADDYNHLWLYFGTGRFYSDVDEADATQGRYIGIREDTTRATDVWGLYDVTNVSIDTLGEVHGAPGCSSFVSLIDSVNARGGWWREFDDPGERNLTTTLVFGGAVLFTTYVPTGDICSYGGEGYLYALYYRTGTAYVAGSDRGNVSFLEPVEGAPSFPNKVFLGFGMPSEPSLYVSPDETKVFVQAGGAILSPVTGIPGLPETGVIIWKGR